MENRPDSEGKPSERMRALGSFILFAFCATGLDTAAFALAKQNAPHSETAIAVVGSAAIGFMAATAIEWKRFLNES